MIDLHCHILPEMDDGPAGLDESLAMARQAVGDGVRTIVATPHTLNEVYCSTSREVDRGIDRLRASLSEERIPLELRPGTDTHICPQLLERVRCGDAVTLGGTGRYLLVEFPVQAVPAGSREELFQLVLNRITPVITHPERNLVFQNDLEPLYDLVAMGCLVQLTAMSITGELGEEAMQSAHRLLELRLAHVIASDAHSSDRRPPVLSPAVEVAAAILKSRAEAEAMVLERPAIILAGETLSPPEPRKAQKPKWWRIWA